MRASGLLLSLILALAPDVHAGLATFLVNSTADEVDAAPGDGKCASAGGSCTLRAAIQEGNVLGGADVTLPAGVYKLTIPGVGEDAAATGDLDVPGGLILRGAGASTTIIDGNGLDAVFQIGRETPEHVDDGHVEIDGVTIKGGSMTIRLIGTLRLTHASFEKNAGGILANGSVEIIDSNFADNEGGIGADHGEVIVERSTIRRNAGGIGVSTGGAQISDTTIADNRGRAISVGHSSSVSILRSRIIGNAGGGIRTGDDAGVLLDESEVSGNTADEGAGILLQECAGFLATNSTISGNRARGDGGGIHDETVVGCARTTLLNTTVTENVADSDADGTGNGGGESAQGANFAIIRNSIIAGNRDDGGEAPDCTGILYAEGKNVVQTRTGCDLRGDTQGILSDVDPALGLLNDNGGLTRTHALLAGSPAINAAAVDGCKSGGGNALVTDQRGAPRPQGLSCDLGAYESSCGNGVRDQGEDCDDGNSVEGDCCSSTCKRQAGMDVDASDRVDVATDLVYIARHLLGLVPVPPSFRATNGSIPSDVAIAGAIDACAGTSAVTSSTTTTTQAAPNLGIAQ